MHEKIPKEEYKKIVDYMPVVCVDLVILHDKKIVLVKRKTEPEKDKWWLPGGRIFKNELLEEAAVRKAFEETGLKTKVVKQLGTYEYVSNKSIFEGVGTHSIVIGFLLELSDEAKIFLDDTSTDYKWVDSLDDSYHPHVEKIVADSGVFK